ncbi:DNA polymerase III subunit chi [Acinetobacter indicus]|uniref:DNA polymerase III subunit chi n=1 Tax=Acinetobacter indicus TaxID=756892 RepID=UPI0005F7BE92|nr:DNA polymerase III subunit chi [Acinetobacter indicus]KJV45259.1 DNA polymerase III subunit chi [Acinetobacter indicus]OUY08010.1 DNA polymerase III subunit chi [Acinetobacter indicus]
MAKVSFYLFEKSPERQVDSTCRLCRKILREPQRIWLYSADPALQQALDERLWSFDVGSFIPHGIDAPTAQVCISAQLPTENDWIVFNFNEQALEQFAKFSHIIEIIENHETAKQLGREKYKQYRRLGIEPQTHKL